MRSLIWIAVLGWATVARAEPGLVLEADDGLTLTVNGKEVTVLEENTTLKVEDPKAALDATWRALTLQRTATDPKVPVVVVDERGRETRIEDVGAVVAEVVDGAIARQKEASSKASK